MRKAILGFLIVMLSLASTARAYERGGIAFILDHDKELKLNEEQKRKLNNMRTLEERTRAKILAESDTKVTIHKWLEALRKKDEVGAADAFGELVQTVIKKSATVAATMIDDLTKLLSPEQLVALNQLKEAEEAKKKPAAASAKKNETNKPKRGTEAPNPFEF